MTPVPTEPAPLCRNCRYYFVTYEPALPHGCRMFGMQSRTLPCILVERESGAPCNGFEPRPKPPGSQGKPGRGVLG
ncbi:MAG: hypothetical protein P1V81_03800 [Planctomycetota bacterium]|nr:hypothetical protein [Planctomycetota bacterium]